MAFDGDFVRERPMFETIEEAWEHSNDLGSRWFFFPFHFVVSGNTIRDVPEFLSACDFLLGKKIKTAKNVFGTHSKKPETQGMDGEHFLASL